MALQPGVTVARACSKDRNGYFPIHDFYADLACDLSKTNSMLVLSRGLGLDGTRSGRRAAAAACGLGLRPRTPAQGPPQSDSSLGLGVARLASQPGWQAAGGAGPGRDS